jgi:hypothetical protein
MAQPVLYIGSEALDMGALAGITVERHNPLLSEGQQSYSLPFTLPRTPRNDWLLGFPARFQRTEPAQRSFGCTLMCGHVQRVGRLHINSIARDAYDCSMSYDTAELLSEIGGKPLAEAVRWATFGPLTDLTHYLRLLLTGEPTGIAEMDAALCIFPIVVDAGTADAAEDDWGHAVPSHTVYTKLNDGYSFAAPQYVEGGAAKSLPAGFGRAPFLRVEYALRRVVEAAGYRLDLGQRAHQPLSRLAVLHNRADVTVNGYIQLRHLLPECTVEDFVRSLERLFCGRFALNSRTGVVTFTLFNDYLDRAGLRGATNTEQFFGLPDIRLGGAYRQPLLELLPYTAAQPEVELMPRRAVKLTMQKSMSADDRGKEFSNATPEEFYSDAVKEKYPVKRGLTIFAADDGGYAPDDGEHVDYCALYGGGGKLAGSNLFGCCDGVQGGSTEDYAAPCEQLPTMLDVIEVANNVGTGGGRFLDVRTYPVYGFGLSYVNSVMESKDDKEVKRPLAFACPYLRKPYRTDLPSLNRKETFGTTAGTWYLHSKHGEERTDDVVYPLYLHHPDGLFSIYHALRDKAIRGGGYRIRVDVQSKLRVDELGLYLFDGQLCMVEQVREQLGGAGLQEVVLQTVKMYGKEDSPDSGSGGGADGPPTPAPEPTTKEYLIAVAAGPGVDAAWVDLYPGPGVGAQAYYPANALCSIDCNPSSGCAFSQWKDEDGMSVSIVKNHQFRVTKNVMLTAWGKLSDGDSGGSDTTPTPGTGGGGDGSPTPTPDTGGPTPTPEPY